MIKSSLFLHQYDVKIDCIYGKREEIYPYANKRIEKISSLEKEKKRKINERGNFI